MLADITENFRTVTGIEFKQFIGDNERDNLFYDVQEVSDDGKKQRINELLHHELDQKGGAVVFVGRRKSAETYAGYLKDQGWACEHFHAGLGNNEKADIQNRFIEGGLRVIVATNAFGMGVDKPDVRLVVHAEITGSLENYLQEAGRAGRDQADAKCVLLYDGKDVDTQFSISKMSQIELRDLKSVWRKIGRLNDAAYGKNQSGEIVATGGEILCETENYMSFDRDDRQADTKVKTALAWLERSGLLERRENQTCIFPARSGRLNLEQALAAIEKGGFSQRNNHHRHPAHRLRQTVGETAATSCRMGRKTLADSKKRNPRCRPRQLAEPLSKCRLPPNARSRFGSKSRRNQTSDAVACRRQSSGARKRRRQLPNPRCR